MLPPRRAAQGLRALRKRAMSRGRLSEARQNRASAAKSSGCSGGMRLSLQWSATRRDSCLIGVGGRPRTRARRPSSYIATLPRCRLRMLSLPGGWLG